MRLPLLCLLVVSVFLGAARAEDPFFKKNDVIALVGGEDMVVASEYGYLETLLTRALPDYHLRFRNLAWEGDTVYEQHRDLNFPSWEEALDKIGATVVICQFGQMESLAGTDKIPDFIDAYEKLLQRFSGEKKRRIVLVGPVYFNLFANADIVHDEALDKRRQAYAKAIQQMAQRREEPFVDTMGAALGWSVGTRDRVHLNWEGQERLGGDITRKLLGSVLSQKAQPSEEGTRSVEDQKKLGELIVAKNKLWFDYWRVENWAFLFGDRTNQPSSRDHRDPSKRWFPAEREEFIPLIEAKEKEIDALAAKISQK